MANRGYSRLIAYIPVNRDASWKDEPTQETNQEMEQI